MGTRTNDATHTDTMKLIIFAGLVALAVAAPQLQDEEIIPVAILREESDPIEGANFRHEFEADNGLSQSMVGSADDAGAQVMSGSYSFPLPVAPLAEHPIPAHAQEQIDFANAQQAAGLVW